MKNIMLIGECGCGKTSLCQRINEQELNYEKTQAVQLKGFVIDTPGEYLEHRGYYKALLVTAAEADMVILLQDPTKSESFFPPGITQMFQRPCIGVVTKLDVVDKAAVENAKSFLEYAGVETIFPLSNVTDEGMRAFKSYLRGR